MITTKALYLTLMRVVHQKENETKPKDLFVILKFCTDQRLCTNNNLFIN